MNKAEKTGKKTIAVVGGGASGLCAAIAAAETCAASGVLCRVRILEAETRVGKKILATGNGRCNLTNTLVNESCYIGDASFLSQVFEIYGEEETVRFFNGLGLFVNPDASGRVYPMSRQATSVLDVLRAEADRLGVEVLTETPVVSLRKAGDRYVLNGGIFADAVIVACGSPAGRGAAGDTLRKLFPKGIGIRPFSPALCALRVEGFTRSLKGVRADGLVRLYHDGGALLFSDTGEIQYTETGLSGIPVMQVSLYAADAMAAGRRVRVSVDSLPGFTGEGLSSYFNARKKASPALPMNVVLGGLLPKKLGEYFLRQIGFRPETPVCELDPGSAKNLIKQIKQADYRIAGTTGFSGAQAALGGVRTDELDPRTMELKKMSRVFVCGEAVDVTGLCGGYNLQWAWSSGRIAGVNAADRCRL